MTTDEQYALNQAAYLRLRDEIGATYPKGRFVALGGGSIIADAESFETMMHKLTVLGWEPLAAMVVRAGDDTPDYLDILSAGGAAPDA